MMFMGFNDVCLLIVKQIKKKICLVVNLMSVKIRGTTLLMKKVKERFSFLSIHIYKKKKKENEFLF